MRICYSDEAIIICKGLVTFLRAWYTHSHPHFAKIHYSQQNKKGKNKINDEISTLSYARKKTKQNLTPEVWHLL